LIQKESQESLSAIIEQLPANHKAIINDFLDGHIDTTNVQLQETLEYIRNRLN